MEPNLIMRFALMHLEQYASVRFDLKSERCIGLGPSTHLDIMFFHLNFQKEKLETS